MSDWKPVEMPTHPVTFGPRERCPYCRSSRVTVEGDGQKFRVACHCGATGRHGENEVLAITFWNNLARLYQ